MGAALGGEGAFKGIGYQHHGVLVLRHGTDIQVLCQSVESVLGGEGSPVVVGLVIEIFVIVVLQRAGHIPEEDVVQLVVNPLNIFQLVPGGRVRRQKPLVNHHRVGNHGHDHVQVGIFFRESVHGRQIPLRLLPVGLRGHLNQVFAAEVYAAGFFLSQQLVHFQIHGNPEITAGELVGHIVSQPLEEAAVDDGGEGEFGELGQIPVLGFRKVLVLYQQSHNQEAEAQQHQQPAEQLTLKTAVDLQRRAPSGISGNIAFFVQNCRLLFRTGNTGTRNRC